MTWFVSSAELCALTRSTVDICRGCYEVQSQRLDAQCQRCYLWKFGRDGEWKAVSEGRRWRCWEMPV
jgi:GAF domain-containing protein